MMNQMGLKTLVFRTNDKLEIYEFGNAVQSIEEKEHRNGAITET
jgi:hypothetical protein